MRLPSTQSSRESRRKSSSSKARYPSRGDWEHHKEELLDLYRPGSGWHLRDIIAYMEKKYDFYATKVMYLRRFTQWRANRNKKRPTQQPVLIPQHSSTPQSFPFFLLNSTSETGQIIANAQDPSLILSTTYSNQSNDSVSGMASKKATFSTGRTPSTSAHSGMNTPNVSSILTSTTSPGSKEIHREMPVENQHHPDSFVESNTHLQTYTKYRLNQYDANLTIPDLITPQASTIEILDLDINYLNDTQKTSAWQKLALLNLYNSSPPSLGPAGFDQYLCNRDMLPTCPALRAMIHYAEPRDFVHYCFLSAASHFKGDHGQGDDAAARAGMIYSQLIWQEHDDALTALSAMSAVLLKYDRQAEAVVLIAGARLAATEILGTDHPIVHTIEFLEFQADGQYRAFQVEKLKIMYEFFCHNFSPRYRHSLVVGYQLAWRLTLDGTDENLQDALTLLENLATDFDLTLGKTNIQSIAILKTMSRVLQQRRDFGNALKVMSKAVERLSGKYFSDDPYSDHPYLLEARARLASLLFHAYQNDEAESQWVAAALGWVRLLGRKHALSKESIQDVKDFYFTTGQMSKATGFRGQVRDAEARYQNHKVDLTLHPPVDSIW